MHCLEGNGPGMQALTQASCVFGASYSTSLCLIVLICIIGSHFYLPSGVVVRIRRDKAGERFHTGHGAKLVAICQSSNGKRAHVALQMELTHILSSPLAGSPWRKAN